ncbi:MAG: hypothetical protein JWO56_1266 [Acidobacteria bacterium]|nr:hypothetical protein [Acidobacteriota bacterium]
MSTTHIHLTQLGYERIDAQIRNLNLELSADATGEGARSLLAVDGDGNSDGMLPRLELLYRGVRPILAIVAELPLIAPAWRDALRLFLATLDGIVAAGISVTPTAVTPVPTTDFKAGKDL